MSRHRPEKALAWRATIDAWRREPAVSHENRPFLSVCCCISYYAPSGQLVSGPTLIARGGIRLSGSWVQKDLFLSPVPADDEPDLLPLRAQVPPQGWEKERGPSA